MELYNINNQLQIITSNNQEFYKFETMKSFSPEVDAKGNWYVLINFIANDKNNSLRLYVKDVTNLGLPNTQLGATDLTRTISQWASSNNATMTARYPYILTSTAAGSIAGECNSFSIRNAGAAAGTVTLSGGTAVSIPAGTLLTYDAGGLGCKFYSGAVTWNATGTTFIVTYVA
jgi:hypothetical protein